MEEFIKDRNEAFASMDKDKIIAYCKKYRITIPDDENVFWAGVHKIICVLYSSDHSSISKEQYDKSYEWLASHGYNPTMIIGGEE